MGLDLLEIVIQPQSIAVILLCLILLAIIHHHITQSSGLPLPPGPPVDNFFLGNSIPTVLYVVNLLTYLKRLQLLILTRESCG